MSEYLAHILCGQQENDYRNRLIIAVLGTGSIGSRHLSVLRCLPQVRAIAIPMRLRRHAELELAGFQTCTDIHAALELGATLCIVATNTGRHVQDGLAAVENGLDVLVEKPLATNALQAQELCLRAVEAGRKVFVGCTLRFSESLNIFRDQLSRIGRVHSVRVECQSFLPDWRPNRPYKVSYSSRRGEGGVLRDLVHEIDYAGWLFGWPTTLQANVRNLGRLGIEADEAAELMWETPDGCVLSICLDYLSRPSRRHMRASGELGTLEWDGICGKVTLALADNEEKMFCSSQTRDEMFLAEDTTFIEACRGHPDPRLATCEDGKRALAVCDAARQAAKNKREEKIDYP